MYSRYNWYWNLSATVDLSETVDLTETVELASLSAGHIPIISDIIGDGYKQAVKTVTTPQVIPAVYDLSPQVIAAVYDLSPQVITMTVR